MSRLTGKLSDEVIKLRAENHVLVEAVRALQEENGRLQHETGRHMPGLPPPIEFPKILRAHCMDGGDCEHSPA